MCGDCERLFDIEGLRKRFEKRFKRDVDIVNSSDLESKSSENDLLVLSRKRYDISNDSYDKNQIK